MAFINFAYFTFGIKLIILANCLSTNQIVSAVNNYNYNNNDPCEPLDHQILERAQTTDEIHCPDDNQLYTKCGVRNIQQHIKSDEYLSPRILSPSNQTEIFEFPWMVIVLKHMKMNNNFTKIYNGGGSLINPSIVLTAGHRVHRLNHNQLNIIAGEWDVSNHEEFTSNQNRNVAQIIIHEGFRRVTLINDIALLILVKPFELSYNIQTVCLPPPTINLIQSGLCTAAGWGKDSADSTGKYQSILKKIDLPIIAHHQCEQQLRETRLGPKYTLNQSFLCAGGESGKDTCIGDGGSALICQINSTLNQYYEVGIVAWGLGCGVQYVPGIYVNVAYFRNWIDGKFHQFGFNTSTYTYSP